MVAAALGLWQKREIVRSLAERDFRARYKQAILGAGWAVIQPLIMVLVFTFTIRHIGHVNTGGIPYALFAYTGLIIWGFFSGAVSWASNCLLGNQPLLNKVSCPREAFAAAAVALAVVDTAVSLIGFIAYFAIYGFLPRGTIYWLPVIVLVAVVFTFGVAMIVSVVVVYLRDLRQIIPLLIQIGLFATPVAYNITSQLSPAARYVYSALNPLAPTIDSARRALLTGQSPQWQYLGVGAVSALVFLVVGFRLFKRLETGIADLL